MPDKTLTRANLADAVHNVLGLSRRDSTQIVEDVLGEVEGALLDGQEVKIAKFGTFSVHEKGERVGRNPKTGQEVPIAPRRVLRFRASNTLKDRVDGKQG